MGLYTPRITNRASDEDIIIGSDLRSKSAELYSSGLWLSENSKPNSNLIGDIDVYEIYSGFFQFEVNAFESSLSRIYLGDTSDILYTVTRNNIIFGGYRHTSYYDKADYFIINKAFSKYYSTVFGSPIDLDNVKELDKIDQLDRVYANDEIQIYKIERGNMDE